MTAAAKLPDFYRLVSFAEIDSTNEEIKRRALAGAPEGMLITAAVQKAGRGRRGRPWVSPVGNLYMSILLRPQCSAAVAAQLGFAAALAVGDAVHQLLPQSAELSYKWPNDVLVDGRKISGILLESQAAGQGRLDWLVIGIGVNLVFAPEGMEYPATSLEKAGAAPVAREAMLASVASRFRFWHQRWLVEGFPPLRQAWLARARGLGEPIRVRLQGGETTGRFAGLDEEGALLLEENGSRRRIAAGDVFPAAR